MACFQHKNRFYINNINCHLKNIMKKNIILFICFITPFILQAAESSSKRKDQTIRIGQKSGVHLMYATTSPIVIEFPGEDWMFGVASGSGKLSYSYTNGLTSRTQNVNLSTTEVKGRYYIGNSFNIPFGYAMFKIT